MKTRHIISLLAAMVLLFVGTGCSYKKIDETLQSAVQQEVDSGVDGYTSDGRAYVEVPPQPEDDVERKGAGESFSAYKQYTVLSGVPGVEDVVMERGTKGLTYTLKKVQVFASIYDAKVDMYGCQMEDSSFLESTPFVLVEMEASYTAPDSAETEVIADATELSAVALDSQMNQQMEEEVYPVTAYFSLRPKEDDPDLDYQHNFFSYRIKDGDPVTFQIGLFCGQSYLDGKNVYLEVNEVPSIEQEMTGDITRKLFVLFPESEE